jgi:mitochondrial import receptor subunit TOM40
MLQVDQDYTGRDFSASIKSVNPSILEGGLTGIFIGSYLQSISPGLALGMEAIWQRAAISTGPETVVSYVAKYRGADWIASAQLQAQGAISTSYWRRLSDKVEVGADLNLQFQPGMGGRGGLMGDLRKEGTATLGAKYDFRASSFRAQADSTGRISALLEKKVLPFVQVTFAAELDQLKVSDCTHAYRYFEPSIFSTRILILPSNKLRLDLEFPLKCRTKTSWNSRNE